MSNTYSDTYPSAASIEGENAQRLRELAEAREREGWAQVAKSNLEIHDAHLRATRTREGK